MNSEQQKIVVMTGTNNELNPETRIAQAKDDLTAVIMCPDQAKALHARRQIRFVATGSSLDLISSTIS